MWHCDRKNRHDLLLLRTNYLAALQSLPFINHENDTRKKLTKNKKVVLNLLFCELSTYPEHHHFVVPDLKFTSNIWLSRTSIVVSLLKPRGKIIIYVPNSKHFSRSTKFCFLIFKLEKLERLFSFQYHWSLGDKFIYWELR